jgi:hypothetical protein
MKKFKLKRKPIKIMKMMVGILNQRSLIKSMVLRIRKRRMRMMKVGRQLQKTK